MIERPFGRRTGLTVPRASFGAMRLPDDYEEAARVIRHAIDAGMRYIDASRGYEDCERKLALALKDGYREKVLLSTKWSPWCMAIDRSDAPTADCIRRRIDQQMKRLETDYLDFYQVWNIDSVRHLNDATRKGGIVDGIKEAMKEGIVRHTGFTAHDTPENMVGYLGQQDWCEVLLLTYNLLERQYAPVLAKAHELGIGTIIMNPLAGGKLAENTPRLMRLAKSVGASSVAELGLRFVLSNENVDTIVSGVARYSDAVGAVAAASLAPFSPEQRSVIVLHLGDVDESGGICTACEYCRPCPAGVDIPEVMSCLFDAETWGMMEDAAHRYASLGEHDASACTACGDCVPRCTQRLDIPDKMRQAARFFAAD